MDTFREAYLSCLLRAYICREVGQNKHSVKLFKENYNYVATLNLPPYPIINWLDAYSHSIASYIAN